MNTLRRISLPMVKAGAAFAVLVAIALPLAVAGPAGAVTAPTVTEIAINTGTPSVPVVGTNLNTGLGQGASEISVVIVGTGFSADPTSLATDATGVTFDSVTDVSSTEISANISVSAGQAVGWYQLTATDANGTSAAYANAFAVDAAPTVTSLSLATIPQNATSVPVVITGTNLPLTSGGYVFDDAAGNPTLTFTIVGTATSTKATGTLTSSGAAGGEASLTVTNPDLGTTTFANAVLVDAPVVATISPSTISDPVSPNTYSQPFTITGSNFVSGATVSASCGSLTFGTATVGSATSLTVTATVAHLVTPALCDITVTNPDGSTGTGTGLLGFGELPPAPAIAASVSSPLVVGGSTSDIALTASNGESFGAGATATFAGTNITGVITPSSATSATLALTIPAFQTNTALTVATTTTAHTSITIGTGLSGVAGQTLTIVDGASSELVAASAYNATTGVVTIGSSLIAHAVGTVVEIPQVGSITSTSIVGQTGETALNIPTSFSIDQSGNGWTGATPDAVAAVIGQTSKTTLSDPGFGFASGASSTNISATNIGVTSTLAVTDASDASISVTTPASQPGQTTLAVAANANDESIIVASDTGITAGEVLTITSNVNTEQVTVASTYSATVNGTTVTLATNLVHPYPSGATVTGSGITTATAGTAQQFLVTNGAGWSVIVNATTTANAVTAPATETPATVGQGAGTSGTGFTVTLHTWGGLSTTPAATGSTGETVTSSDTQVTFGTPISGTASTVVIPVFVAAGATLGAVPVTITLNSGLGNGTDPDAINVVAGPTITAVTGSTVLTAGTTVTLAVTGTNFTQTTAGSFANGTTPDPAVTGGALLCTATDVTNTVPGCGAANMVVNSATSATITVGPVLATALGGSDALAFEDTADGGTGFLLGAVTVQAPIITGVTATTGSFLAANFDGAITITGTGFAAGTLSATLSGATISTPVFVNSTTLTATVSADSNTSGATPTLTLTDNNSQASFSYTVSANPVVSTVTPTTAGLAGIAIGETAAPVTITGSGFLPGATVTFSNANLTGTVTSVTPYTILVNVAVSTQQTAAASGITATVTNTNGGSATGGSLSVTLAPTITSATSLLGGAAGTMTITGTGFDQGAVVSAGTAGLVTFGTAVVNAAGTVITVPVTPIAYSGTIALSSSLIVTNPAGGGSATDASGLVINPGPGVTGTYYVPTFSTNLVLTINGSGFEPGLTATSSNPDYTVVVGAVTATTVSLVVTTDSNATAGTSSQVTFTNPDGGTVTFTLNGGPVPSKKAAFKLTKVSGQTVPGRTVTVIITGAGFYGQPKITSNAPGTKARVTKDSGKELTVRVTVKAGGKAGRHTFTVRLANGKTGRINYTQK